MPEPDQDPDYRFAGEPEDDWTEAGPGGVRRLRPDKRNLAPRGHGIGVAIDVYTKAALSRRAQAAEQLKKAVLTA